MEKFNVLIQAYQHLKIHRETLCCIIMKFLTECKHTDVMWPTSGCSYQARVRTGNLRVHVTYLRVWTRKFGLPSILERGIITGGLYCRAKFYCLHALAWWQLVHLEWGEDAGVLLNNVTGTVSVLHQCSSSHSKTVTLIAAMEIPWSQAFNLCGTAKAQPTPKKYIGQPQQKPLNVVFGSRPSDHYFRNVCLSVCLSVCLCRVFLSRLWSNFDQTRTHIICLGLVVSPRI